MVGQNSMIIYDYMCQILYSEEMYLAEVIEEQIKGDYMGRKHSTYT